MKSTTKEEKDLIALDKLLHNAGDSIFCLTRIAMIRALEIHNGSPPLVKHTSSEKETTIALREIAQGKVVFKAGAIEKKKNDEIADIEDSDNYEDAVSKIENIVENLENSPASSGSSKD